MLKPNLPLLPGIALVLGRQSLVLPPLSLGSLETLQERLATLNLGSLEPASIATVVDATHQALLRNYPEITRAQVAEWVDLGNMAEVMQAAMDVSGLRRKEQAAEAGKAPAGQSQSPA